MSHPLYENFPKEIPTKGVRAETALPGVKPHRAPGQCPTDASRKIPVRPAHGADEYCGTRFRSSRREARSIDTQPSNLASVPYGA
ncbi:hypothetical protein GCM10010518_30140 [Kitasatospora cinereorecta]